GLLRAESGRILRELFDFGELTAREVMTPRVQIAGLPLGAEPPVMRALVAERPYSRYPVYGEDLDQISGVVHVKDLIAACEQGAALTASIVRPMPYVPETAPLGSVIDVLRKEGTPMAIVIDEHGGTAGVVTLSDLFDEVIGEIDEPGRERPSISRDYLGRLHVKGTVRVEEVGEQLGVALEHPEVGSVSGLVLTLLGRPPRVGDRVEYDGVHFEVTATEGHGVSECIVALGANDQGSG
ncbi:MAG: hemolysin family protein, partial [Vicinamibacteraceae bacterium]